MRLETKFWLLMAGFVAGVSFTSPPVLAQSVIEGLSQEHGFSQGQQPSRQQIEAFCAEWGQSSDSERRQYQVQNQYERYCDRPAQQIEPRQEQQQQPDKPRQPRELEPAQPEPEPEPRPEPEIQPAKPEPAIPEPKPLRLDLAGELRLDGPMARQPGERQRLRVTVENRGPDAPPGNRLWARVFLSDRDLSRQGGSARAFSFPGRQPGRQVRIPEVPGPGQSREVMAEVVLPTTLEDGNYWWCVQVDSRQAIEETDEGNNVACARKVVALGGESDSELSDVFGSKVAELSERPREGTQTVSQPSYPGLLRQSELDRLAAMLMKTGGTDYTVFTGQLDGDLTGAQKRGLLLMRDRGDLIPLGGDYYADGRGNRVLFGGSPGSSGDEASYAVTLLSGGGLNLVVDIDRDGVVDLGVSEGLKDRFGFLTRPGMEHILDCMRQMVQGGARAAGSLPQCLSGGSSDDGGAGGGGTGAGGEPGSDLASALEPECGSDQGVSPGGLAQSGGGMDVVGEFWSGENPRDGKNHIILLENPDTGEKTSADVVAWFGNDRDSRILKIEDSETGEDLGFVKRKENGEREHKPPKVDMEFSLEEAESAGDDDESQGQGGGRGQPGPGPGGIEGPAGGSDPRCEEPTTWNRLATEECANDMAHCINKLTDPLYNATGGQCRTARGSADNTTVECEGNDSFGECIEGGDDVRSCAEEHAGGDNGGDDGGVTPGENDDIFKDDQGTPTYGLLDVHPFGATLAAMCRGAGGIGPCGDPSPAMDAPGMDELR